MDWQDDAIVLSIHRHGEANIILEVLTREHGRHKGYVRGGAGRRMRGVLQPGNELNVTWKSRVEGNLGNFSVELTRSRMGELMGEGERMSAVSAIASVCTTVLPEREVHGRVYSGLQAFLDVLILPDASRLEWGAAIVMLELGLLHDLGFGLDLTCCAATGVTTDLIYVSPRTGRAVSREFGKPYSDRLLALPPFLTEKAGRDVTVQDVRDGLLLTGHFLEIHAARPLGKSLPDARLRFEETYRNLSN